MYACTDLFSAYCFCYSILIFCSQVLSHTPPAPVSSYSNDDVAFQVVANAALDVFPQGLVVPGLMVGNTDTRHYQKLTKHIYR